MTKLEKGDVDDGVKENDPPLKVINESSEVLPKSTNESAKAAPALMRVIPKTQSKMSNLFFIPYLL
jgi:hypothetical protein